MDAGHADSRRRLDSWKDVADYLSRDVSTVMRWARTDGLPVHHVGGAPHRAVFAWTHEIDAWLEAAEARDRPGGRRAASSGAAARPRPRTARAERASRRWLRFWWVPALALGVVLAGTWAYAPGLSPARSIVRATLDASALRAFDAEGHEIWRHAIPTDGADVNLFDVELADLDGNGRPGVVAAFGRNKPPGDGTGEIRAFDERGRLRWTQTLDARFTFGTSVYAPGWYPNDVAVFRSSAGIRVAAAWHHHTWWPSVVTVSDAGGRILGRFVNAGWIQHLASTQDGRFLLAAGVSNALGGIVLAVLDAEAADGASPSAGGSLPACVDCPAGAPVVYVVVPWSDLAQPPSAAPVSVQVTHAGIVELRAGQLLLPDGAVAEIIVELSPRFEVVGRNVSDAFLREHRRLEAAGALDHPVERCPWKTPEVRVWTRARGWNAGR